MSKGTGWELLALWSLAVLVVVGSIYITRIPGTADHSETPGIVIGGLMAALPMLINAIRNIGQARTMQQMAEQLGQSSPIDPTTPQQVTVMNKSDDPLPVHDEGKMP